MGGGDSAGFRLEIVEKKTLESGREGGKEKTEFRS